jgi:hypothetical protein
MDINQFFQENQTASYQFPQIPEQYTETWQQARWIIWDSHVPYIPLDIDGPWKTMLAEAVALDSEFVTHRSDGEGWSSLCIHGLSAKQTESPDRYPEYADLTDEQMPYRWTEIVDRCPVTTEYFQTQFPFDRYSRLRYMKLAPRGTIPPHVDGSPDKPITAINISLNNPDGCAMIQGGSGIVPFKDSGGAIMFNNTWQHAVRNLSQENRYHIIVHGMWNRDFEKLVVASYKKLLESV